jgi:hypothetical protein
LILNGQQRKILREAILGAYPNPDNLQILLSEQMDVQLGVIARGDAYNTRVFSLIQDFEADGRIEKCIQVIVADKPNSPYIKDITTNFPLNFQWIEPDVPPLKTRECKSNSRIHYIERPPVESSCIQEILKEGALLRIKGSQKMGKTLLMNQLFDFFSSNYGYRTASIDLREPEEAILSDLGEFLQYFCSAISEKLGIMDKTGEYWINPPRSKALKCHKYFEQEILSKKETALLVGLDNIDRLFSEPFLSVSSDFFGMLRAWYGDGQRLPEWKKLRLILVYSTEELPNLGIYQSPFSVGYSVPLPEFTRSQVLKLAQGLQLDWSEEQATKLMELVGGHPYLIEKAITHLSKNKAIRLKTFLEEACTDQGIYHAHFQRFWKVLEVERELANVWKEIVNASDPISIRQKVLFKLDSWGLIAKEGNGVKPRCQLYRLYFSNHIGQL